MNVIFTFQVNQTKRMFFLFFTVFLLLPLSILYSQNNHVFRTITIREGLSQSLITGITQDKYGFMWFSTNFGLNRFDGYTADVYNKDRKGAYATPNCIFRNVAADNKGQIFIASDGIFYLDSITEKFVRIEGIDDPEIIKFDSCNNLWYSDRSEGLYFYDLKQKQLIKVETDVNSNDKLDLKPIGNFIISKDQIWISYSRSKFVDRFFISEFLKNKKTPHIKRYSLDDSNYRLIGSDNIYLYKNGKIYLFDVKADSFKLFSNSFAHYEIHCMIEGPFNRYWVGTRNGLFECDRDFNIIHNYNIQNSGLPSDRIHHLFIDRTGILWIGTLNGIAFTDLYAKKFRTYLYQPGLAMSLPEKGVIGLGCDNNGLIWIASEFNLAFLDEKAGNIFGTEILPANIKKFITARTYRTMIQYAGENMLIATVGLNKVNLKKRAVQYSHPSTTDTNTLNTWRCWTLHKGKASGKYWIGQNENYFSSIDIPDSSISFSSKEEKMPEKITRYKIYSKAEGSVWALLEDRDGILWVGCEKGLIAYNPKTNTCETYFPSESHDTTSISHSSIKCFHEDSKGYIWMGTEGMGLNRYDKKTRTFKWYSTENGLCNNNIVGILEDEHSRLWISTRNGLSCFDPATEKFKNYYYTDGLQSNEFNHFCHVRTPDGRMCFGGNNGVTVFHPDSIQDNPYHPKTLIKTLYIFNKPVNVGEKINGDVILEKSIQYSQSIHLSHINNVFSFEFVGIHYSAPEMIRYKYMLEGFDPEWRETGANNRMAHYNNLKPGKYVFRVKSANLDNIWDEKGESLVVVTILPPWWETWWFKTFMILLIASSIIVIFRWRVYALQKQKEELEKLVVERTTEIKAQSDTLRQVNMMLLEQKEEIEGQATELKKLNATKDKFFSIIGHDLKNPMYAIHSLTELVRENPAMPFEQVKEIVGMINQSSKGVTSLLENLLTWARSQSGKMDFKPEMIDLYEITSSTLQILKINAENKGLLLKNEISKETKAYADKNMITTVIRNLVNNAIKFTSQGGVTVSCATDENESLKIYVTDTGVGMSEETRNKLFSIHQNVTTKGTSGEAGTGLGLIICQEFIEKNGGKIWVESEPGKGSSFIFTIHKNQVKF